MKILWITNTLFPAAAKNLGLVNPVGGGWMYSLAEHLSKQLDIELAVATIYRGEGLNFFNEENINYYLVPCRNYLKYQKDLEGYWDAVCTSFRPDIVHIHGSEYPHGLACMKKRPELIYILSVQGIVSIIERYYLGGISNTDVLKNITFRDIVRMDTLFQAQKKMRRRSIWEKEIFKRTKHIIGRTSWDKIHAAVLSPHAKYHFCNETLRKRFYTSVKWEIDKCHKHSIFLSQSIYPLKGFHQVLKSVSLLISEFPDIHISIAGPDITQHGKWQERLRLSGYGRYIRRLIHRYNLSAHIDFKGELNEDEMVQAYLKANVFVCPSMIENSPNSLGEAQMLGVPSVAAYVGGIPDMMVQGETGVLYRFEEFEMLATAIRQLFSNIDFAKKISKNAMLIASKRHNPTVNFQKTLQIYNEINTSRLV